MKQIEIDGEYFDDVIEEYFLHELIQEIISTTMESAYQEILKACYYSEKYLKTTMDRKNFAPGGIIKE